MRLFKRARAFPAYGEADRARVMQARDGTFRAVGAGYGGRVRYSSAAMAMRAVESHAQYTGWEA